LGPAGHSWAALLTVLGVPVGLGALVARPSLREGLAERLGAHPGARHDGVAPTWIHAASVGEARAALGLIDPLRRRGERVVASTVTVTGRAYLRDARPDLPAGLAPLDHPWLVRRALGRVRPARLVLVETELWPAWIAAASERGVPVAVVSARLSDRSFPRYQQAARLLGPTLRRLDVVGARGEEDARRFVALGVPAERVEVTGDLKLDAPDEPRALAPDLARALGELPLLVAGSTREGEEDAVLDALDRLDEAGLGAALVIAPRHPVRFDAVAALVRARGRRLLRRSALDPEALAAGDVLLLDTLGELGGLWPRATLAFVGGSLEPFGGHNVLEPVQQGTPVLFGPHVENAREAAARVLAVGAGEQVADAASLATRVVDVFTDPDGWRARGLGGREALLSEGGAAERTLRLLDRLPRAGGAP
jgi:3-deoxy-D-manno-octulosonic-acid transferase